jgi:hypothetical protein
LQAGANADGHTSEYLIALAVWGPALARGGGQGVGEGGRGAHSKQRGMTLGALSVRQNSHGIHTSGLAEHMYMNSSTLYWICQTAAGPWSTWDEREGGGESAWL